MCRFQCNYPEMALRFCNPINTDEGNRATYLLLIQFYCLLIKKKFEIVTKIFFQELTSKLCKILLFLQFPIVV